MTVFNSLGSNYTPKHLLRMITGFDPRAKANLSDYLAERYQVDNVELTYKGREALYLALSMQNLDEGDEVAVNGYTCYAVYDAIVSAGLVPVYVDVDKSGLNFSAKSLEKAAKEHGKLKVVIIQNTLGYPAETKKIKKVCDKNKLFLIEDLAHSIGTIYSDGKQAGTVADFVALSFSQDKAIDSVSGGALLYKGEPVEFEKGKLKYRRFLKDYYYVWNTMFIRTGYTWGGGKLYGKLLRKFKLMPRPMDGDADDVKRPDDWHCSFALERFEELDQTIRHRLSIAEIYEQNLPKKIKISAPEGTTYLRFPIRVDDPMGLIKHLKKAGIHVSDRWYDAPVSPIRHLGDTNYHQGSCPNSEKLSDSMVNLPTHVNTYDIDAEKITEKVNEWLSMQE